MQLSLILRRASSQKVPVESTNLSAPPDTPALSEHPATVPVTVAATSGRILKVSIKLKAFVQFIA